MGYDLAAKDLERVNKYFPKYLCVLCLLVLRDPMQTPCAHLYCKICLESLMDKRKSKFRCHVDGLEFDINKAFPDGCIRREVLGLKIHCPNGETDCRWEGELKSLEEHLQSCDYTKVPCVHNECSEMVKKKFLAQHLLNECSQRVVKCDYCLIETKFSLLEQHIRTCESVPITCSVCGKKDIKRSMLSQHNDPNIGDCEKSWAVCPFLVFGCQESKVMALRDRRKHEQSLLAFHVNLLVNAFLSFKKEIEGNFGNSAISDAIKTNVSQLAAQVMYLTKTNEIGQQKIKEINTKMGKLDENLGACAQSNVSSDIALLKQQFEDQVIQLQERDRKLLDFEAKTQNYEFLLGEANRNIEEQAQEIFQLKKKLEEATENLRKLSLGQGNQRTEPLLRPNIVSWDEMPSTDGTLTWKISNFTQRQQDAISGRNTSFYSPAFYTSRNGYKMCARIYLNGDGMGRNTHISLFFVLMRGEYDALLRWPFKQKVIMMILDQDNREHLIDAFRPDPNSSSFQRPRREMNIASGCPLFCPLAELGKHAYVRDDVMFVKVVVECEDL